MYCGIWPLTWFSLLDDIITWWCHLPSVTCYLSLAICHWLPVAWQVICFLTFPIWNLLKFAKTCFISLVVVRLVLFFVSIHRLYYTQNVQFELKVSMQKSGWKNMPRSLSNLSKCDKFWLAKLNLHFSTQFGRYLRPRCIFFKTDFCIELLSSSRTFWV